MAEMMAKTGGKNKHSLRIDLTPMVDLGFLLISFFMMTTTLAQPKALDLNMPDKTPTKEPTVFCEESTLTLIPAGNHRVYWYKGSLHKEALACCTKAALRPMLQKEVNAAANLPARFSVDAHKLHVIIKPEQQSTYSDLVEILDEMLINNIGIYVIADLSAEEVSKLQYK
jgi:biopolymer transport protein ExbD